MIAGWEFKIGQEVAISLAPPILVLIAMDQTTLNKTVQWVCKILLTFLLKSLNLLRLAPNPKEYAESQKIILCLTTLPSESPKVQKFESLKVRKSKSLKTRYYNGQLFYSQKNQLFF